jgi:D-glycero-D-manno-heptose 1,7-bisphosphate phosphatase
MKAVFLDRDGVINENRPDHVKSWAEFRFLPGAPEAVAKLTMAGMKAFIVSNQAIVNRGMVSPDTVDGINQQMIEEIERRGGRIEAVAYCPHRPDENCLCRKPEPGLLLELAQTHGVNLQESVIIGDSLNDIEAGLAAGCQAILVLTGRGNEQFGKANDVAKGGFRVARDLVAAVDLLLGRAQATL